MIYLSGKWTRILADAQKQGYPVGMLCQPNYPEPPAKQVTWAADTGIFGTVPFSLDRYLYKLEKWSSCLEACAFATAPDVVADWPGTLQKSLPVIPAIKQLGYPVALVLQDGATSQTVPWHLLDAVFVGGTTRWKLSEAAYRLVAEANERNLWTHMGRVNSLRRLHAAVAAGYNSADGTYVAYGPDTNSQHLLAWLDNLILQPSMALVGRV